MQREFTEDEIKAMGIDKTEPETVTDDEGWSKDQIKRELLLKGFSIAGFERQADLPKGSVSQSLISRRPKTDKLLAKFLGVHESEIWPLRYLPGGASIQKSKKYTNSAMAAAVRRQHEQMRNRVHLPEGVRLIRKFEVR